MIADGRALLGPEDVPASEGKTLQALARYRLELVESPDSPSFEVAYALLAAEFAVKGELERREVLEGWLRRPPGEQTYRLVVALDADGNVAGARDFHVVLDAPSRVCVVYLAHVVVVPGERRTGLGGIFRHLPAAFGRRASEAALPGAAVDLLLAAEMEPVRPGASETIVRLVAYGRAGYRVVEPARLPYCQPDFRSPATIAADPGGVRPLPLLAVVRWVGHEGEQRLPARLARAVVERLYSIFATHCRRADLEPSLHHSLETLASGGDGPVALLQPPRDTEDVEALRPLALETVLAYHPRT